MRFSSPLLDQKTGRVVMTSSNEGSGFNRMMGIPIRFSTRSMCSSICGNSHPVSKKTTEWMDSPLSNIPNNVAVESFPPENEIIWFKAPSGFPLHVAAAHRQIEGIISNR